SSLWEEKGDFHARVEGKTLLMDLFRLKANCDHSVIVNSQLYVFAGQRSNECMVHGKRWLCGRRIRTPPYSPC
ncbi:hypothetical protein, partial [Geobacillus sp. WSUCF1]|uniref:hypothetical protein n=1 Tax=Geobacillus sp. WSUCF1 TaxID=886559 RepID=UPI001F2623D3